MNETNTNEAEIFNRLTASLEQKPEPGPLRFIGEVDELLTALAVASGEFTEVKKDTKGQIGNQTFMYTTLAGLRDATRPALAKQKIATFQSLNKGMLTFILAGYGARIESDLEFTPQGDVKEFGRQTTYLRRYQYNAFFELDGVEDADTPNAARSQRYEGVVGQKLRTPPQPAETKQRPSSRAQQTEKPAAEQTADTAGSEPQEPTQEPTQPDGDEGTAMMSPAQKSNLKDLFLALEMPASECRALMKRLTGKDASGDMTFDDAEKLVEALERRKEQGQGGQ
ncbi:MAG: hypothetical protein V3U34_00505 [candidate division NC10 bacterium]